MTLGSSPAGIPRLAIRRIGRGETYEVLVSRLDENGKVRLLYMNQAKLGRQQTRTAIVAQIAEARRAERSDGSGRVVVLDHPLLVETGTTHACDEVVVVTAPEDLRVSRLVDQRGMDESDARARIAAQTDDATRVAAATHVVDNSGDVVALEAAVELLLPELGLGEA